MKQGEEKLKYQMNGVGEKIHGDNSSKRIINDVTQLNPITVNNVETPTSVDQLQNIIKTSSHTISVGGGRYSMGGQTASPNSTHIDMRQLNQIIDFSKEKKTITVQTGIRWCDIQAFIDQHDLSIKIMQTYANFTVGGSLNVNVHGRYIGFGPLILSVLSIDLILADGSLIQATPSSNQEYFFGAIGCFNAIGVISQVTLSLSDNTKIARVSKRMSLSNYKDYFFKNVRENKKTVFHNGDIYPPYYTKMNAVSWVETHSKEIPENKLMTLKKKYPLEQYFLWAFSETFGGKWRRQYIIDPILFLGSQIRWRNYEAGYDVLELEPKSRKKTTYVLQEYFVPVRHFEGFSEKMSEIFQRHNSNVLNVSVRHAKQDTGSLLAWAPEEVFAFVVYYKQRTDKPAKEAVAVWTRELIDAAISFGGAYYLPYQAHATQEQFHKAYPNAHKLFELKAKVDPDFKFRNILWDTYYLASGEYQKVSNKTETSTFKQVYSDTIWRDKFYRFLQVIFHLYPEAKFHSLIRESCSIGKTDEEIYALVQQGLPNIKTFLSEIITALPALFTQKKVITNQTLELLGSNTTINGYLEIGTTGRYISSLQKHLTLSGELFLLHDVPQNFSPADIFERGQYKRFGTFLPLNNYSIIMKEQIASNSLDLVTCYIGLHHIEQDDIAPFILSIHRILKPSGKFILRDHDVTSKNMEVFVSLLHTVFNLGLGETWETNTKEYRNFQSLEYWSNLLESLGFRDSQKRIFQQNDPSDNALMLFTKV